MAEEGFSVWGPEQGGRRRGASLMYLMLSARAGPPD